MFWQNCCAATATAVGSGAARRQWHCELSQGTYAETYSAYCCTDCCRYFFVQHPIAPQIARAQGFSLGPDGGAAITTEAPYPEENGTTAQETMDLLKKQTDEVRVCVRACVRVCVRACTGQCSMQMQVLATSAVLTGVQKMRAACPRWSDDKLVSLAAAA
jgi:hypothetical protein